MKIHTAIFLAVILLSPVCAIASKWTEFCDRHELAQGSTVCVSESWSTIFWDKQSPEKQAEIAARPKRWGRDKALAYCREIQGPKSRPGPDTDEQDIMERIRGDVYVGIRINPQCIEPEMTKVVETSGDARRCVVLSTGGRSQTLGNACDHDIEVVWCHDSAAKNTGNARCGNDTAFYRQSVKLRPGEKKEHFLYLPLGATIRYGACFGGAHSTKATGVQGEYTCRTADEARNAKLDTNLVQELRRLIRDSTPGDRKAQLEKINTLQARCNREVASPACDELKALYDQRKKNAGDIRG